MALLGRQNEAEAELAAVGQDRVADGRGAAVVQEVGVAVDGLGQADAPERPGISREALVAAVVARGDADVACQARLQLAQAGGDV